MILQHKCLVTLNNNKIAIKLPTFDFDALKYTRFPPKENDHSLVMISRKELQLHLALLVQLRNRYICTNHANYFAKLSLIGMLVLPTSIILMPPITF